MIPDFEPLHITGGCIGTVFLEGIMVFKNGEGFDENNLDRCAESSAGELANESCLALVITPPL